MIDHNGTSSGPSTLRPWLSRWNAPTMMLLGVLVGVGFGLGHHLYYQSFADAFVQSTSEQQWTVRIGTGLAFLTKTAFTAVIGIAFSQYLWVIARKKPLSLENLDAMFAMISNPISFLDINVLASAKLLTLVGIVSWLLPLIATVTPATLTVESRAKPSIIS
ncbi:hypothetical protein GJ744_012370 [Endocarpon pusillum]|uniref:Uncharacterized protein n=1 Tax=Endocarpon pusillum TaxID=364733 RepID=A0A8H7E2S6_9EURO|nr:hypothetical protein GJ744_012370 [Endocarpon pusillum]